MANDKAKKKAAKKVEKAVRKAVKNLISKFGSRTIESIDKFELQTHVNHLART